MSAPRRTRPGVRAATMLKVDEQRQEGEAHVKVEEEIGRQLGDGAERREDDDDDADEREGDARADAVVVAEGGDARERRAQHHRRQDGDELVGEQARVGEGAPPEAARLKGSSRA